MHRGSGEHLRGLVQGLGRPEGSVRDPGRCLPRPPVLAREPHGNAPPPLCCHLCTCSLQVNCGLVAQQGATSADARSVSMCDAGAQVLQHLAAEHEDLLTWHLAQQKQGLKLCVAAIGGNSSSSGGDAHDGMYTESEEDYLSEEEDAYQEDEDPAVAAAAFHEAYRAGLSEAANALGRRVNHYFPSLSRQSPINQTRATRF